MLVIWLAVNDHTLKDHTKSYSCRRAENKTVFHVPNKGNNIHLGNTKGMKKHLIQYRMISVYTLQATLCGHNFPKPSGGDIFLSRVTTSRCFILPLKSRIRWRIKTTASYKCGLWMFIHIVIFKNNFYKR